MSVKVNKFSQNICLLCGIFSTDANSWEITLYAGNIKLGQSRLSMCFLMRYWRRKWCRPASLIALNSSGIWEITNMQQEMQIELRDFSSQTKFACLSIPSFFTIEYLSTYTVGTHMGSLILIVFPGFSLLAFNPIVHSIGSSKRPMKWWCLYNSPILPSTLFSWLL
jgi:hypothetical protein